MKRKATNLLTTMLAIGLTAGQAMSATICGVAKNTQGNPVNGCTVTVKDSSGKVLGQGTTDDKGKYEIRNLGQGTLDLFLDTGSASGQSGSGVLNMVGRTEKVNWQISDNSGAVASQEGPCDDPGLTMAEWASIGVLGLAAGGGIAAIVWGTTGDRSDHEHQRPISPLF